MALSYLHRNNRPEADSVTQTGEVMPNRLTIHFSRKSLDTHVRLVLMHSDSGFVNHLDEAQTNTLMKVCNSAEFTGKSGQFLQMHAEEGPVLIAGIGKGLDTGMSAENWGGRLYEQMKHTPFNKVQVDADLLPADILLSVLNGALSASYYFDQYFTVKKDEKKITELMVLTDNEANLAKDWEQQKALVDGVFTARDLLYEPANILYPDEFARRCTELEAVGLDIHVLNEAELEKMGMGALLGVGQGSRRDSSVVVMNWQGGGDEAPVALVGKGVCFDTGGISLKPAKGMEDMKWDMGGAAAVTGAMHAIAGRKVKRNVVGVIGLVENMPDGNAQRPGDVVTSMSGQTIEVINTDAEGRLVLADVLTYIQDTYKPQAIIDLATLTGAIIVSLGKEYAGLFANNDQLAQAVSEAGNKVDEKCWRMPMGQAYDDMLKSHIADMKNIGGPYGGSITAACFLQRFIKDDTPWVHLDIAGKAWSDKAKPTVPKGGTGFGVRLLNRMIDDWTDMK